MPVLMYNEPIWRPHIRVRRAAKRASRCMKVLFLELHPTFSRLRRMLASGGETRWTNTEVVSGTSLTENRDEPPGRQVGGVCTKLACQRSRPLTNDHQYKV